MVYLTANKIPCTQSQRASLLVRTISQSMTVKVMAYVVAMELVHTPFLWVESQLRLVRHLGGLIPSSLELVRLDQQFSQLLQ